MQATPVYISLARGLAQSTDPDLVAANQGTLKLENCVIQQKESIVKRAGTVALSNLDTSGNPIPTFARLASRGSTLVGVGPYGSGLYAYSDAAQRWAKIPSAINGPTSYDLTTVAGGQISAQSSAYLSPYIAIGFVNQNGEGEARIVDAGDPSVTLFSAVFTATGGSVGKVRVLACNSLFVWVADDYNSQEIRGYVVDPANPTGVQAQLQNNDIHPWQSCFDVIVVGNTVRVAYATQSGHVEEAIVTPTASSLAHINWEVIDASGRGPHVAPTECMSYVRDLGGSGKVGLVVVDLVFGVRLLWDIAGTGSTSLSYIMEGAQSLAHHTLNVTACTTSNAAAGDVQVIIEFHPSDLFVATCAGALAGTWTTAGTGIGKTLHASATGVQTVDGHALALNDVVLVTIITGTGLTTADLGLYKVTTAGAVGVNCVLTRATNFDTAAEITRDALVRVTTGSFSTAQYHVSKVLDAEDAATPPGTFTLDRSALQFDFLNPAFSFGLGAQTITQYRRFDRYLWTCFKTSSNVVTNSQWTRGLGLTSHIYQHGGHRFVWANYDNQGEASHQGSYFLLECPATTATGPATPQAAFAVDVEAGIQPNSHLQDVSINLDGNALGAILIRTDAVAIDDGQRSIQLAEFELNPTLGHHVEVGGSLFTPGGVLGQFDGASYFSPLFPFAPDGLSAVPSTTVGGLGDFTAGTITGTGTAPPAVTITGTATTPTVVWIECTVAVTGWGGTGLSSGKIRYSIDRGLSYTTAEFIQPTIPIGTTGLVANFPAGNYATDNKWRTTSETLYRVAVVFKNTDATGRVMRSEPCYRDVVLYAGQSSINVEWIPFYRLGDKSNVQVELYRSQANVPEVLNLAFFDVNNTGADFGTFTMTDSDARIAGASLLYTDGGVLPNTPAGGVSELCVENNRIFAVEMDDPTIILASTPLARGVVPSFTDTNYLQAKAPVTALASFVENLIVFAGSVYGMPQSAGPNSQGQGIWPELQVLDPDITTTQPLSVCVIPDGVAFLSQDVGDGYQLLTRSLLVEPFGIDVRDYLATSSVTAAVYVPKQSQLRIYTTFGGTSSTIVYDSTHKQFSTFTGQDAVGVALWGDLPVYCAFGSGAVRAESVGNYLEATTFGQPSVAYDMDILSPWIQIYVGRTGAAPNVGGFFRLRDIVGKGRASNSVAPTLNVDLYRDFSTTPAVSLLTTHPNDGAWKFRGGFKCSALQVHLRVSQTTGQPPTIHGFTAGICAKQGMRRISGRNAPSV